MDRYVIFFIITPVLVNAQELRKDSVKVNPFNLLNPPVYLYDEFEPEFLEFIDLAYNIDEGNIRLFSSYLLSNESRNEKFFLKVNPHLLSNYHKFYIENSRFNAMQYILGMAQVGAVGYLAYKHIKKYGLK